MKTQINFSNQTNKTALAGQASTAVLVFENQTKPKTKAEAAGALKKLWGFIGRAQLQAFGELCFSNEKQYFFDKVVELAEVVETMPVTYQTDGQGDQAMVHLHYFTGGADWYITERDVEEQQLQAFGLADLGYGGELGYISIVELLECGAELDLHWTPQTLAEVKRENEVESALNDFNSTSSIYHY